MTLADPMSSSEDAKPMLATSPSRFFFAMSFADRSLLSSPNNLRWWTFCGSSLEMDA